MTGRTPTERQYHTLLPLASGNAGLSRRKHDINPLLRHGWVTADWDGLFFQMVRITPDGLRAVAAAVEKYGLPDLGPRAITPRRVCADCGSTSFRIEHVERKAAA